MNIKKYFLWLLVSAPYALYGAELSRYSQCVDETITETFNKADQDNQIQDEQTNYSSLIPVAYSSIGVLSAIGLKTMGAKSQTRFGIDVASTGMTSMATIMQSIQGIVVAGGVLLVASKLYTIFKEGASYKEKQQIQQLIYEKAQLQHEKNEYKSQNDDFKNKIANHQKEFEKQFSAKIDEQIEKKVEEKVGKQMKAAENNIKGIFKESFETVHNGSEQQICLLEKSNAILFNLKLKPQEVSKKIDELLEINAKQFKVIKDTQYALPKIIDKYASHRNNLKNFFTNITHIFAQKRGKASEI
jgi:hypothetical protein